MESIEIKELIEYNMQVLPAVNRLLGELVSPPVTCTEELLRKLVSSPSSHLFLLYVDGEIAGMFTLGTYVCPTSTRYWVEDVVVGQKFRGRSLGRRIIEYAIDYVGKQGDSTLMLTSRPARVAANRLYRSVGFQPKETNVYTMEFLVDESNK